MKRAFSVAVAVASLVAGACVSEDPPPAMGRPEGPAQIDIEALARHENALAEIGPRAAGSQRELAAATYILGHLQKAGYVPVLDPVPVADLVRSTNIVAPPPGDGIKTLVVAPYDSTSIKADVADGNRGIAVFLEIARALAVADPDHDVEFAALGAENSDEGPLGSRRLAKFLLDEDQDPLVIIVYSVERSGGFAVAGDRAEGLEDRAVELGYSIPRAVAEPPATAAVMEAAGFDYFEVTGGAEAIATVLFEFLSDSDR